MLIAIYPPVKRILLSRSAQTRNAREYFSRQHGFTLIELLITITIIGILAAIIIPSYNDQVQRTRRGDAKASLMRAAQSLERCFSDTSAFNDPACPAFPVVANVNDDGGVLSDDGTYLIAATQATTATTFRLRAKAPAGTPQGDNDNQCDVFFIDHTGLRTAIDNTGNQQTNCW